MSNRRLIKSLFGNTVALVQQRRATATGNPLSMTASFTSGTPTDGNFLVLIISSVQLRNLTLNPSGWIKLTEGTYVSPQWHVFYKHANSESNSYPFTYGSGGTNGAYHIFEFSGQRKTGRPIMVMGESRGNVVSGVNASSTSVPAPKGGILLAHAITETTVANIAWSNSFTNKIPATGNTYSSSAMRSYSSFNANQNSQATSIGSSDTKTVLLRII